MPDKNTMFILRGKKGRYALPGKAPQEFKDGALDEDSANQFADIRGYKPFILPVPGLSTANSPMKTMAMEKIGANDEDFALYGFSAGGYSIFHILRALKKRERERLQLVVVLGAPGPPDKHHYRGPWELIFREDPSGANGHMRGPQELLKTPFKHD